MDAYEVNFLIGIGLVYFWPVLLLLAIIVAVAVTYVLFCLTLVAYGLANRWLAARWARVIAAGDFLAFPLPLALRSE
jgi:hypothetical protein